MYEHLGKQNICREADLKGFQFSEGLHVSQAHLPNLFGDYFAWNRDTFVNLT